MTQPRIDEEDARAGHTGDGLLPMLIIGLGLVIVSFGLVAFGVFG
jgi:hypothetical protein